MITLSYPDLTVAALLLLQAALSLRVASRCLQIENGSIRELEVDAPP